MILIGRLTADPEIRQTNSGKTVASYRLAVDRNVKTEGQPEADFINCTAWGKTGEFAEKYLRKGMKIAIEGRIQTGSYEKDDRSTTPRKSSLTGMNFAKASGLPIPAAIPRRIRASRKLKKMTGICHSERGTYHENLFRPC